MRVFVAGASGAIGTRLVPQLIARGHEVTGTFTSSPEKAERIRGLGAGAVALDLLDATAVRAAVLAAKPDAIIHQATALAGGFSRKLDKTFAQTNRLRTEGTDALLAAAREAGVSLFVAQSFAPYRYAREGGMVKTEDDPLIAVPAKGTEQTFAAMAHLDKAVTGPAASRSGTAASTATPATRCSSRCAGGCSRSSATAKASCRTFTSTTRPRPPSRRSSTARAASTTSWTTIRLRFANGCRCSPASSAPSHPATCPPGWRASWQVRTPSTWEPAAAVPPTPRPSGNSDGRCVIQAGGRASRPPTDQHRLRSGTQESEQETVDRERRLELHPVIDPVDPLAAPRTADVVC